MARSLSQPTLANRIAAVAVPMLRQLGIGHILTTLLPVRIRRVIPVPVRVVVTRALLAHATEAIGIEHVRQVVDEMKPHVHPAPADNQTISLPLALPQRLGNEVVRVP